MSLFTSHTGTKYNGAYVENNELRYDKTLLTGLFKKENSNEIFLTHNCDIIHIFILENGNYNFSTALKDLKAYFQNSPNDHHALQLELLVIALKENYILTHNPDQAFARTIAALKDFAASMK